MRFDQASLQKSSEGIGVCEGRKGSSGRAQEEGTVWILNKSNKNKESIVTTSELILLLPS